MWGAVAAMGLNPFVEMTDQQAELPQTHGPGVGVGDRPNHRHINGQLASAHHLTALHISSLLFRNKPVLT